MKKNIFCIGCLGDSLTDGYPGYSTYFNSGENERSSYPYWLNKLLLSEFENYFINKELAFINKGICGEVTEQIKARLKRDMFDTSLDHYGSLLNCVIIIGGTNDLGYGIAPSRILANIADIHRQCKENNVLSIGASIPPTQFENDRMYNKAKKESNDLLIKFFKENNIAYADLYKDLSIGDGDDNLKAEYDIGDGFHFSEEGYRKMAESLFYCFSENVFK